MKHDIRLDLIWLDITKDILSSISVIPYDITAEVQVIIQLENRSATSHG